MKSVLVFLALLACSQVGSITIADVLEEEWANFKLQHSKSYSDVLEEQLRSEIFKQNKRKIDEHNERWKAGKETYSMGVNQFTDLLSSEFEQLMLSEAPIEINVVENNTIIFRSSDNDTLPASKDWRDEGAVTPVKDQGSCRACYAFSAVGTLESHIFINTNETVILSEQNIIDCSAKRPFYNGGCNFGTTTGTFLYMETFGVDTEASYGYIAKRQQCKYKDGTVGAKIRQTMKIPKGDEDLMKRAVAKIGPLSVTLNADGWQSPQYGVYSNPNCNPKPTHGVIIVGYGTDEMSGLDYWLVKNSFGSSWGLNGYIKIARNQNNQCGVANQASYPII